MSTGPVTTTTASPIVAALQKASAASGSDFRYLLNTAMRESGLQPQAQASSSSASGLFQFVEQTWLGLVKKYGAKYGLGSSAAAIREDAAGRYHVDNAEDRQAILSLRQDAQTSALMAGEYAGECKSKMQGTLGRQVSDGELYAAHFLGAGAACRLISLNESAPGASAAQAFPQAAAANRSVFYRADGSEKSVGEVYAWATKQHAPAVASASTSNAGTHLTELQKAEYVSALAQFETNMLARALFPETSAGTDTGAATPWQTTSPLSLSYGTLDLISALQGVAQKRGAA